MTLCGVYFMYVSGLDSVRKKIDMRYNFLKYINKNTYK